MGGFSWWFRHFRTWIFLVKLEEEAHIESKHNLICLQVWYMSKTMGNDIFYYICTLLHLEAAPCKTHSHRPLRTVITLIGLTKLEISTCSRLQWWLGRSRNPWCFTSLWIQRHTVQNSWSKVNFYTERCKLTGSWYRGPLGTQTSSQPRSWPFVRVTFLPACKFHVECVTFFHLPPSPPLMLSMLSIRLCSLIKMKRSVDNLYK